MKVRDLKKHLENVPDDLEVVCTGDDHSFIRTGGAEVMRAEYDRKWRGRQYLQYFDEENRSSKDSQIVDVFWIDDGRY